MWVHSSNFHRCFESRGQGVCEAGESSLVVAATAAAGATWLESLVINDQAGRAVICSWRGVPGQPSGEQTPAAGHAHGLVMWLPLTSVGMAWAQPACSNELPAFCSHRRQLGLPLAKLSS